MNKIKKQKKFCLKVQNLKKKYNRNGGSLSLPEVRN